MPLFSMPSTLRLTGRSVECYGETNMRQGNITLRADGRCAIPVRYMGMSLTVLPKPDARPYGERSSLRVNDLFDRELLRLASNTFHPYCQR